MATKKMVLPRASCSPRLQRGHRMFYDVHVLCFHRVCGAGRCICVGLPTASSAGTVLPAASAAAMGGSMPPPQLPPGRHTLRCTQVSLCRSRARPSPPPKSLALTQGCLWVAPPSPARMVELRDREGLWGSGLPPPRAAGKAAKGLLW